MSAYQQRPANGFALIVVLWILVLLSLMAGSLARTVQRESGLVGNARDRAQALALADAGVHYAMLMLLLPDPMQRWRGDGAVYEIPFAGARIRMRVYDEAGKININAVQEELLRTVLNRSGLEEERAIQLADAILDWRDGDELKRLHGAEKKDYQDAGRSAFPTNKNFRALDEVRLVLGMTADIFRRLEPLLTAFSGVNGVNPAKASREVLLALPNTDEDSVDDYLARRRQSVLDKTPPPPFPAVQAAPFVTGGDTVYAVFAEARLAEGQHAGVKAILRREGGASTMPFVFLDWKYMLENTSSSLFDLTAEEPH